MPTIHKIGLFLELSRPPERDVLRGVTKYSHLHGPWSFYRKPLYYTTHKSRKTLIKTRGFSEFEAIIAGPTELCEEMLSAGIPIIVTANLPENLPERAQYFPITADSKKIGIMAAEYFLLRNFRNFAYYGFSDIVWSKNRKASFCERVAKDGFEADIYEASGLSKDSAEQDKLLTWLKKLPKPAAMLSCNDDAGEEILEICKEVGIKVPEDISVLGVDNDNLLCNTSNPSLSSVAINFERAGYQAAETLDEIMNGQTCNGKAITAEPTHITTRRSSDLYAVDDPDVAEALGYIRDNYRKLIQVSNIAEAVGVPRRTLEQKFKKALNQTVYGEIRRFRMEHFAKLLVETDLNISEIAGYMGYMNSKHLASTFRKVKGMNPVDYRNNYGKE